MAIMCDTNVILDILLDRMPFADNAAEFLKHCLKNKTEVFVSALALTDIFYIVKKSTHSSELTYSTINKLLPFIKLCDTTALDAETAFQKCAKDFEDCLVSVSAKRIKCSCVVTRNSKDFAELDIPALTPTEFLKEYASPD